MGYPETMTSMLSKRIYRLKILNSRRTSLLLCFLFLLASYGPSNATDSSFSMVGQLGGPTKAVAVQGNYAYVGIGLRLVVLDISNPSSLTEVGSTTPFPHLVEGIAVSGNLAYVAAGGAGLRVVDISNPTNPTEVGYWDSPGYAEGVAVSGTTVFLADGPYGLQVVDVSNSTQPRKVGSVYDTNYAFGVVVSSTYAYIAAAGAGLLVAEVSDPTNPVASGTYDTSGYAYGLAVSGNTVYLADGWDGVKVLDVSVKTSPSLLGEYKTPGWAFGVTVSGTSVYVADAFKGLRVLDCSNPSNPSEVGSYEVSGGHAGGIAVAGSKIYLADRYKGLKAIDVSIPTAPTQVGVYNLLTYADAIAISGNYGYVAAGLSGLRVLDISNPANPTEVGTYDTKGYATVVSVKGKYAYVATMTGQSTVLGINGIGIHIVDIADPAHPTKTSFYDASGASRDMVVVNGIAYLANEWGLEIVDVSNPASPTKLGFINMQEATQTLSSAVGLTVSGTYAYVACEQAGLKIVDISNSTSPTIIGTYKWSNAFAQHVAVSQGIAYIANTSGMAIIDVSNPGQMTQLGYYSSQGFAEEVTVDGSYAYLANGGGGLLVIDISNPSSPTLSVSYKTSGYAQSATVSNNYIFIADQDGGVLILEKGSSTANTNSYKSITAVEPRNPFNPQGTEQISTQSGGIDSQSAPDKGLPIHQKNISSGKESNNLSKVNPSRFSSNFNNPQGGTECIVTSASDSGANTLRWCLENSSSGTKISFDSQIFPPSTPKTISLSRGLPDLSQGNITIDASNAGVILDGSATQSGVNGLNIISDNNVIKGLQILYFPASGIFINSGAKYNQIGGNRQNGSGPLGEGNLLSGNGGSGLALNGATVTHNIIKGNYMGTDITGTKAIGNKRDGIGISSPNNQIGGLNNGEGNHCSGNESYGIGVVGTNAYLNQIVGNYVGVDASGSVVLGNGDIGIGLECGAYNNTVKNNIIVTTGRNCLLINDSGSSYNVVTGNYLGTDASGTVALGGANGHTAVNIGMGAGFNRIGGTKAEERNVIVGGIGLGRQAEIGNLIIGNYIGTDKTGTSGLSKKEQGVAAGGGIKRVFIGGTTSGERNVISGNPSGGVRISSGGDYIFIGGNYIGTDSSGTSAVSNQGDGINIGGGEHIILQNNVIGYNTGKGVSVTSSSYNTIRRNAIFSNSNKGISLSDNGNNSLSAPVISTTISNGIFGTACAGCTVEVFSDSADEGKVYEGSTVADTSGAFTFDKGSALTGPHITATATDSDGNTSEFSSSVSVPQITTNSATNVTSSSATLNGTVNANNTGSINVYFQYVTTTSYGSTVTADQSPVTGSSDTTVSKAITGLSANTTYYYRVIGVNTNGTFYGSSQSFTTAAPTNPDFIITNIDLSPSSITPNSTFSADITVKNQGTVAGDGGYLDAWANQATNQACGATGDQRAGVGTLAAGESKTITLTGFSAGSAGTNTFRAFVDSQCQNTESDETNNQLMHIYQVGSDGPDFLITNVTLTPGSPAANSTFSADITVKNQGTVAGDGGYLDAWANQATNQACGATGDQRAGVGTLAAGESKTITLTGFSAGSAGTKTFRAFVDSQCQTAETDETNNQYTKSWGDQTLMGKIGIFRNGAWFLDYNGNMQFDDCTNDRCLGFGLAADTPVVGDWDGSGTAKIGVFRDGYWFLDYNGNGQWDDCTTDRCFGFGITGDTPVAGDWNGSGTAKIGVFRDGYWFLDYNGNGQFDDCTTDRCLGFGLATNTPVVGDWDGSGTAKIGVFRDGTWSLDYNGNGQWDDCTTDRCLNFGMTNDVPVTGDWDGSGTAKIGVFRDGVWALDYNGNGQFDDCTNDRCKGFGMTGDNPVTGAW